MVAESQAKKPVTEKTEVKPEEFIPGYLATEAQIRLGLDTLKGIQDWPVATNDEAGYPGPETAYARGGAVSWKSNPLVFKRRGVCHGFMSSVCSSPAVVFSKWNYRAEPEFHESQTAWFDWITGPDSPWRDVFPPSLTIDGEDLRSPEFMWKNGFLFWHLDKLPSNLQQSFLIASRQATQHPNFVLEWHHLVKDYDFDPAYAMLFLSLFSSPQVQPGYFFAYQDFRLQKKFEFSSVDFHEFPLGRNISMEYVENFVQGRPAKEMLNKPYRESQSYTPVNDIWHPYNSTQYYCHRTFQWVMPKTTYTKYNDHLLSYGIGKKRARNSAFAEAETSKMGKSVFTWDEIIELADKEQKRLKIGKYKEGKDARAA